MKVITGDQMREIEQIAINETGIPSILLMENAALRLTERCLQILKTGTVKNNSRQKVVIFCGPGNNGGDGFALAYHLFNHNIEASVFFAGDEKKIKGDPAVYLEIIKKLGVHIEAVFTEEQVNAIAEKIIDSPLVVDALLGTGLNKNVEGVFESIINIIKKCGKYVLSVDIPSGVHSGTGKIMGCAVKADETITFAFLKTGIAVYPGTEYAGKVFIEDISLPENLTERIKIEAQILTEDEAKEMLPPRRKRSNKGSYGKIMIFAGSDEMPGAAALASSAAYMTGGGLVCACVLQKTASVIHKWQREVVTRILPGENGQYCKKSADAVLDEDINQASVIVIGPGIGRSSCVTDFVRELIKNAQTPLVIDADALFAISEDKNILKNLKAPCIITPHAGEMSRLTGIPVPEIMNNIIDTAVNFSKECNVVTLLKDARTIIAHPDGNYFINTTGSNALSKAGTGDVLAGMISGFIAQGLPPFNAGVLGAFIHGKAGETAALHKSNYGVTASDLIKNIPLIINNLQSGNTV